MEAIKESVSQMSNMFMTRLAEFEARQQKLESPTSTSAQCLAAEFTTFKKFILGAIKTLQAQVDMLALECDSMVAHSRRKILLLHGVPEDKEVDTVTAIIQVVAKLELPNFKSEDISRCHRMGRSTDKSKPRPILVKLCDMSLRGKIWAAKTKLKGSGITMSEFLSKGRHNIFMAARQRYGVSKCYTRDGVVFVLDASGERRRVNSIYELDNLEKKPPPTVAASKPVAAKESKDARTKRVIPSKK